MTTPSIRHACAALALLSLVGTTAHGLEAQTTTRVMVRVTANDAKLIGSGVFPARTCWATGSCSKCPASASSSPVPPKTSC